MANVAALSGLTVAWRRVFRGGGPGRLADAGDEAPEEVSAIFQSSEITGGAQGVAFCRRQELGAKGP
jgi:hypothetical protein